MLKIGNLEFSSSQCLRVGVCVGALQYIKMLAIVALGDRGVQGQKIRFSCFPHYVKYLVSKMGSFVSQLATIAVV